MEHISQILISMKKLKNLLKNKYIMIICRYCCIGFIDFMLKGKSILEYTNLFSPNEYKKNDKIILKYIQ